MPKHVSTSLVVQGNPLVEARYRLPLLAQQVLKLLMSMIESDTTNIDREFYQIDVARFGKAIKRRETSALKEELTRIAEILMKTPVLIRTEKGFIKTVWIQAYRYHNNEGRIDFLFSKLLNPFLIELKKRFTQYRLDNIFRLDSQYSIRIYELIRQYVNIGFRTIPLDELKAILGVGKKEYEDYRDFRKRVLDVACKNINAKTDLRYSWEPVKEKKRVIAIRFYDIVTPNKATDSPSQNTPSKNEIREATAKVDALTGVLGRRLESPYKNTRCL